MIRNFDDLRDFALTFVDKMVEDGHIESDIDTNNENEFDIQDTLIEHVLERFKQDDCITPNGVDGLCIDDINEDYDIAFISVNNVPLGIFTIFTDDDITEDNPEVRQYVSVNHTVHYLD